MTTEEQPLTPEQLLATTGYSVPMETVRAIFRTIETILSANRPTAVQLSDLEQISEAERRNLLLRATVANPPADLPRTLIVKKVIAEDYNPDDATAWDTARFLKDWAGTAFLSQVAPGKGHSPQFYGGNRALGLILLEDMGVDHGSLVEPLLGVDIDHAEAALYHFAERIAHMHRDTWQREAEFTAIVTTLHPQLADKVQQQTAWHERVEKAIEQIEALGITPSQAFMAEIAQVTETIVNPGPFAAYCHGDPCPDNFFWQDNRLCLLDFEFGHIGHALRDLAYGRMIFPTCWCCNRVPPTVVDTMERRYRTIVAERYPPILDDVIFGPAMTEVCAAWLIDTIGWLLEAARKEDQAWGIATLRPRIDARLTAFIDTSITFDHLPAIRLLAEQLRTVLQTAWPAMEPLPFFPALRG